MKDMRNQLDTEIFESDFEGRSGDFAGASPGCRGSCLSP
jgi:hypothetical protein